NLSDMAWALLRRLSRLGEIDLRILLNITLDQTRFSGTQAMLLTGTIATILGGVSIIQSFSVLSGLADDLVGVFLVGLIVRELGPLVTAVVLIGRSGTAMAAELGSMRLNGEIDVLLAHRIDPLVFVVLPRMLGGIFAMLILCAVFDLMGILGGFAASMPLMDLSFALLRGRVLSALTNQDLFLTAAKAVLFGGATAFISCYFGLRVQRSPTELPQAVTRAVVTCLGVVFLVDGILAAFVYLL
ncbi:MAG: ABC transporter permease, partial [Elusimicrobiota bacterium]